MPPTQSFLRRNFLKIIKFVCALNFLPPALIFVGNFINSILLFLLGEILAFGPCTNCSGGGGMFAFLIGLPVFSMVNLLGMLTITLFLFKYKAGITSSEKSRLRICQGIFLVGCIVYSYSYLFMPWSFGGH